MTDIDSTFDRLDSVSGMALSQDGTARRERMLGELTCDMQRVHRSRRSRRIAAVVSAPLVLLLVGGLLLRNLGPNPAPRETGSVVTGTTSVAPAPQPQLASSAAVITIVRTTAPPPDQLIARSEASIVRTLSDGELLDELAAMQRPAGLVRAGDRTWLTRNVADL